MRKYRDIRWLPAYAGIAAALLFSFYLMTHTFSYDPLRREIRIAAKAWSDFGAHIPLIRSFSYGPNLARLAAGRPVESPLFPGEPIRYHFGFYALAGLLEKLGVRLDWALNIPSALGFFLLLAGIWSVSFVLFDSTPVSILSVLFFLFNGSLSFLRFFAVHPLSIRSLSDIVTNTRFPAFGPWDGNDITAFWTLNIYTNQRHLAFSYGIILTVLSWLLSIRGIHRTLRRDVVRGLAIAAAASALLFFNYPAVAILSVFSLSCFLLLPPVRRPLLLSGLFTIPAIILLFRTAHIGSGIAFQPGYLAANTAVPTLLRFWRDNLGISILMIPLGFILAPGKARRLLMGPMLILFILPNLFRFSPDMINNHKFFNFFLIIGNMFTAYAIVIVTKRVIRAGGAQPPGSLRGWRWGLKAAGLGMSGLLILTMTLSGIIDFFPIINDTMGSVPDIAASADARFYLTHTKPGDVVANSTWFYHPASIAGRPVYSGYTYFTWSYGYDQSDRERIIRDLYAAPDINSLCGILTRHTISYVELSQNPESYLSPNWSLWDRLPAAYANADGGRIYSSATICTKDKSRP